MRARKLSRHTPEIIWKWGVCETYRDPGHLDGVVKGKRSVDAKDVLALEISAADRVWVVLRKAFLPATVLRKVMSRIVAKIDDFETRQKRQARAEFDRAEAKNDYWLAASRVAGATVGHVDPNRENVAEAYAAEYGRQLQIIREEIDSWLSDQGGTQ